MGPEAEKNAGWSCNGVTPRATRSTEHIRKNPPGRLALMMLIYND